MFCATDFRPNNRFSAVVGDTLRLPKIGDHALGGFSLDHRRQLRVRQLL